MTLRQQVFTSPGTWSQPNPSLAYVDVILVGGGGSSTRQSSPPAPTVYYYFAGGGGGIRIERGVPVSGPVPVTIGAGGSGPVPVGGAGGDSSFGPITVGGGGAGNTDAPPNGGGGGAWFPSGPGVPVISSQARSGGQYGTPSGIADIAGGGGTFGDTANAYGLGAGGTDNLREGRYGIGVTRTVANTGAGALSYDPASTYIVAPLGTVNTSGASGIVIVRWFE